MITLPRALLDSPLVASVAASWPRLAPDGEPRTRFAPSPTGELHLGHVAHMGWLAAIARVTGATVLVRMEDHDRTRCRPEFERTILDDLDWLGFGFDQASRASLQGPESPWRQSDHPERYQAAFDMLRREGLLYGCTCTRGDLPPPDDDGERRYPGTCRGSPVERDGRHVVRVRLPDDATVLHDLNLGPLRQHPAAERGDPVIRDALGQWTYQFAVVVDDLHDRVNLIVRGDDIRSSTGQQWLLARMLGRREPFVTVHHPLLLDENGRKLSKRDGATSLRSMRERGMRPVEVLGRVFR
jgi:glutamyl-tRNA synthetase/glutamyl-Q tRNA(Asp) synthetase